MKITTSVKDIVTVSPVDKIDINTASPDVLQSLGINSELRDLIMKRKKAPFTDHAKVSDFPGINEYVFAVHTYRRKFFDRNEQCFQGVFLRHRGRIYKTG